MTADPSSGEAARQLGYDRKGLANVRVRYIGPASLTGPDAGRRYVSAAAPPPPAPAPYQAPAYSPAPAQTYTPPPSATVSAASLAPIASSSIAPAPNVTPQAYASATGLYRIQAGAFGDQANAQRAASQLSVAGRATVEPIQRGDTTLYRVMLPSGADEGEAWALRDRVASFGYDEARVIRPF